MIKMPTNWKDIKEAGGDFPRLTPGGYVCVIKKVTDFPEDKDQFIEVEYDVVEGDCKNIALDAYERFGNWSYKFRVYYRQKSLGFFKHFVSAVEKTNPNFTFNFDNINCLVNKGIGLVIGTRQYYGRDGSLKEAPDVQDYCTANDVREDALPSSPKVREPRNAPPTVPAAAPEEFNPDELPF